MKLAVTAELMLIGTFVPPLASIAYMAYLDNKLLNKLNSIHESNYHKIIRHLAEWDRKIVRDERFWKISGIAAAGIFTTCLAVYLDVKLIKKVDDMFFPSIIGRFIFIQTYLESILHISSIYRDSIIDSEILKDLKKLKISFACDMPFLQEDIYIKIGHQDIIDCCYYLEYKKIKDDLNKLADSIAQHQNRNIKS